MTITGLTRSLCVVLQTKYELYADPICCLSLPSTAYGTNGIRHTAYGASSLHTVYGKRPYVQLCLRHTAYDAYILHMAYGIQRLQRTCHTAYGIQRIQRMQGIRLVAYGIQHAIWLTASGIRQMANGIRHTAYGAYGIWHKAHDMRTNVK
jgi:hypothetical protein